MTANQFKCSAIGLKTKLKSLNNLFKSVWLVPAQFNCTSFMNDPRKLPAKLEVSSAEDKLSANVLFHERATSRLEFSRFGAVAITATQKIEAGEELLVDYSSTYES